MSAAPDFQPIAQQEHATRRTLLLTIALVVAVIIFTTLLFSVALFNSVIGLRGDRSASSVGTVTVAAERVGRVAATIWQARGARLPADRTQIASGLADIAQSVTDALDALHHGGLIAGDDGVRERVLPVSGATSREALDAATTAWQAMGGAVTSASAGRPIDAGSASEADRQAGSAIAALNRLRRAIVVDTHESNATTAATRNVFTALAVVTFLFIVSSLLGRVRDGQNQLADYAENLIRQNGVLQSATQGLARAKSESDTIMRTVNQGLFLMSPDFKISGQYSRELETIFRMTDLEGNNVLGLLQRLLTERMFNATKKYLAMLFDERKKQRTILQINPLSQIEVNFPNPDGGYTSRYLSFAFRRIVVDGAISRVFVAVNDVTDRVELEMQLRTAEARKDKQFEFLLTVLHVEPRQVDEFITLAQQEMAAISAAMRSQDFANASGGQMTVMRQRLEKVFRSVHSIKGNAQMLKLSYFVNECQLFEGKIVALRNRSALGGDDFLTIVIAESELSKDIEELLAVRDRFAGMRPIAMEQAPARSAGDELVATIASFASETARSNGKLAHAHVSDFDADLLDDERRRGVRDVLIQLVRNSIVHGIESPADRVRAGKPEIGTLAIVGNAGSPQAGSVFSFTFRDDGGGLDIEGIRARAVANGMMTAEAAAALAPKAVVGLIFQSGFSTASSVTADAGRGVGMDVVKDVIVDRLGGSIGLRSERGRFTEFSISLPLAPLSAHTNGAALAGVV